MSKFADRPAIAERRTRLVRDPVTSRMALDYEHSYTATTYRELWRRANIIAAEFAQNEDHPVHARDKVAFLAFASGDYAALDLACIRLGAVTIPLQTTSSDAELAAILAETEPVILAVSPEYLERATPLALGAPSVRRMVLFDFHSQVDDHREMVEATRDVLDRNAGPSLTSLVDALERGAGLAEADWPSEDETHDPLAMLIYTFGSTGSPKGAMYIESLAAGM
ncbi:long-subunit acyl-CoA synthetase (AMP-forming) [Roseospira marina]|nr:long-subunit acyl-CoA synthetase (AMP-forming) [Roseospira marina]MBB5088577.1 long-subunit acyl-CoA synthetase (AMP-forming) [Roseospira marina]